MKEVKKMEMIDMPLSVPIVLVTFSYLKIVLVGFCYLSLVLVGLLQICNSSCF